MRSRSLFGGCFFFSKNGCAANLKRFRERVDNLVYERVQKDPLKLPTKNKTTSHFCSRNYHMPFMFRHTTLSYKKMRKLDAYRFPSISANGIHCSIRLSKQHQNLIFGTWMKLAPSLESPMKGKSDLCPTQKKFAQIKFPRAELISSVECVCADGSRTAPLIIF